MNAKPYPEYKESGVQWLGNVPEHWEVVPLKFIAGIQTGYAFSSDDFTHEGIPVLRIGDITKDGSVDFTNAKYLPENHENTSSKVLINRGAIVMAMTGATIGKAGKYDHDDFALLNQRVCSFYSLGYNYQNFLWYLLKANFYLEHINITAFGGAQPNISDKELLDCIVTVPPLPEQTAIADFLDRETGRIDGLVAKKRRLIELLREKRTALVSRTVTRGLPAEAAREFGLEPHTRFKASGIDWLGEVPEMWEVWKLSHGFQNTGSGTTPPSDNDAWYDGDIPWVTTSELRESIIYETSKNVSVDAIATFSALKLFPGGSLAIAMYGATIGRLGILGVPATTNQACCVMYGERALNARFMFLWFQAFREQVILLATGGGQPNISQEKIRSIRVACPSISEQTAIATYLDRETSKIDRLVEKVEAAVERLQEYRAALITAAVTGKIDVREAVE